MGVDDDARQVGETARYVEVATTWRVPIDATDNAWINEAVEAAKALTVSGAQSINFRLVEHIGGGSDG